MEKNRKEKTRKETERIKVVKEECKLPVGSYWELEVSLCTAK
jgi:hypothetical protein